MASLAMFDPYTIIGITGRDGLWEHFLQLSDN